MRSLLWLETRQQRVEQRLLRSRAEGDRLCVGDVLEAFGEVSDFPSGEEDVRIVAQALGILPVAEVLHLLEETQCALTEECAETVRASTAWAGERLHMVEQRSTVPVRRIQERAAYRPSQLTELAAVLQALVWALQPPGQDEWHVCGMDGSG